MPPLFGPANAYLPYLQDEAFPASERIAANDTTHRRSLSLFGRRFLPRALIAIMNPSLTDREISCSPLADEFAAINPFACYRMEVLHEHRRLRNYPPFLHHSFFQGRHGSLRRDVLIRHLIKRRWEKLGIWNPEWGIPRLNGQPKDNIHKWRWRWEQNNIEFRGSEAEGRLLRERAMRLRQNLRRCESKPEIPRSHLNQDANASEAESFLISRPWITYNIEVAEEYTRYHRLDPGDRMHYGHKPDEQVVEWWKKRGDWREKFDMPDGSTVVNAWKWRHESPSPEPEDLTFIDNARDSLLHSTDMEFTPSELDAFDAIPPHVCLSPPIGEERMMVRFESPECPWNLFPNLNKNHCKSPKLEAATGAPSPETQYQLRDGWRNVDQVQSQNQAPPRRSARTALMKRSAEPLPSTLSPNKKLQSKTISRAAALQEKGS